MARKNTDISTADASAHPCEVRRHASVQATPCPPQPFRIRSSSACFTADRTQQLDESRVSIHAPRHCRTAAGTRRAILEREIAAQGSRRAHVRDGGSGVGGHAPGAPAALTPPCTKNCGRRCGGDRYANWTSLDTERCAELCAIDSDLPLRGTGRPSSAGRDRRSERKPRSAGVKQVHVSATTSGRAATAHAQCRSP